MSFVGLRLDDLTGEEERALHAYKAADETSGISHCFSMNAELRAGLQLNEMTAALAETVRALDSVFERCPKLTSRVTVFRGTGSRAFLPVLAAGFRFRSHEFWSTSRQEDGIEPFIGLGGAILELELPAGLPAYDMETLAGAGGFEREILLPRGILWEVVSVAKGQLPPILNLKRQCVHHDVAHVCLKAVGHRPTTPLRSYLGRVRK